MDTLLEYKCPCCGGKVEFSSKIQKMKCPYCETVFDIEALQQEQELDAQTRSPEELKWEASDQQWDEEEAGKFRVYCCESCGGEIMADETTAATHCPYCGSPVILTGQLSGGLKPDYVIPFKLDKQAAKDALRAHMTGKKLLPKLFREESRLEEIKGVYVPFWLFDAEADADGHYKATRSKSWSDSSYIYTETSYFSASRNGRMCFTGIPVDGASKIPNELMESVEPFDFSEAKPFRMEYLSGFLADRYDVSADENESRANQRIRESVDAAMRDSVTGYDRVQTNQLNIKLRNASAKYALFPVWLMTTSYQGQNYLYAMNGQNGKIAGDMPIDKKAQYKWHAIYTAAFGAGLWALWLLMRAFF